MTGTVTTRADADCVAGLIFGTAGAHLRRSTPLSYACARVRA
jgi:hypothetical protein